MRKIYISLTTILFNSILFGQDWKTIPVPAALDNGLTWKLQSLSDDFNYEYSSNKPKDSFSKKWKDGHLDNWKGYGLTEWSSERTTVSDGNLALTTKRVPKSIKLAQGCITSNGKILFPVFIEAKVKISNSLLGSNIQLLASDKTQEINLVQAYGADIEKNNWYSKRLHLSHKIYSEDRLKVYKQNDPEAWFLKEGDQAWSNDWARIGLYWKDPYTLQYYVNGKLVRTVEGQNAIDPSNYSNKYGLNKPMKIIINTKDQTTRTNKGLIPSDNDLKNRDDNTYRVDWIRIYKPTIAATKETSLNGSNNNYNTIEQIKTL